MNRASGKTVGARLYLHLSALDGADNALQARIGAAEALAGLTRGEGYNLVRLDLEGPAVALLHYPDLFDAPFPALAASWLVDPQAGTARLRTYADSLNPPILHRKELLLPADHPRRAEFAALTEACEAIGLFDESTRIGYRRQWLDLVREKGYRIEGHALVPLGNAEPDGEAGDEPQGAALFGHWQAARQLTALVRYGFSAPVQSLARYGFLDGRQRVFDYGCGRGDDLRGLAEHGLDAAGWDPFYAPDRPLAPADIVNLGFVINVIEDPEERLTALTRAWSLAERLLVVSVMLANQNAPRGEHFRDGVLTRRGTFQKYFTQAEIRAYLVAALDEEPIPVAPGVLYESSATRTRSSASWWTATVPGAALYASPTGRGASVRPGRHGRRGPAGPAPPRRHRSATTPVANPWTGSGPCGWIWAARRSRTMSRPRIWPP